MIAAQASAQGQPVDRGTGDLGPNSASQRVVQPGIGQFSSEGALIDRFATSPATRLANLYHQPDAERRYLYRAPGFAAVYNQSDYITRDGQGVAGINRNNTGNGQVFAITPADVIYILSPELLESQPRVEAPLEPLPGQVDGRVQPMPLHGSPYVASPEGQLDNRVQSQSGPGQRRFVDVQAIHDEHNSAQRDPRLVERSRRWREQREREAQEAAEREAEAAEPGDDESVADDAPASEAERGATPPE